MNGTARARRVSHPLFAASDRLFRIDLGLDGLGGVIPRNTSSTFAAAFLRLARSSVALTTATRLPVRLSTA